MTVLGFHASHEQHSPARLLRLVQLAEHVGFTHAMCSDHLSPWNHAQGHAGFSWAWLGAALQATRSMTIGVVASPLQRYHPLVLAQASATLGHMFPARHWVALGSGEFINEYPLGDPWPEKTVRQGALREAFTLVRRLHRGEIVSHDGFFRVREGRLWDLASPAPELILPALTEHTAYELGSVADGLITVNQPFERMRQIIAAYREGGGEGLTRLQVHLSWADSKQQATRLAQEQWGTNVFDSATMADLATPEAFESRAENISDEALANSVHISADLGEHFDFLRACAELGFDEIYLHHVGANQTEFIRAFARLLPDFSSSRLACSSERVDRFNPCRFQRGIET